MTVVPTDVTAVVFYKNYVLSYTLESAVLTRLHVLLHIKETSFASDHLSPALPATWLLCYTSSAFIRNDDFARLDDLPKLTFQRSGFLTLGTPALDGTRIQATCTYLPASNMKPLYGTLRYCQSKTCMIYIYRRQGKHELYNSRSDS